MIRLFSYENAKLHFIQLEDNDLAIFETELGGKVETFQLTDNLVLLADEEAVIKDKYFSAIAVSNYNSRIERIHGNFMICRINENGDFCSIEDTDEKIVKRLVRFTEE